VTHPLFACRGARIDAEGSVLIDGLSVELDGTRVGLVGHWSPLFRLFSRSARLARGSVEILGEDAAVAVASNLVGLALTERALPGSLTVNGYLRTSARLLGVGRFRAVRTVRSTLAALGIEALAKRKLGTLDGGDRTKVAIAEAVLGGPPVIAVERPLSGLSESAALEVRGVLERAAAGRRLIVSIEAVPGAGPEESLFSGLDRVALLAGGDVALSGPPREVLAGSPRCVVWASRRVARLADALAARGLRLERAGAELGAPDPESGGRLVVHLENGATPNTIVETALAVEAPLLELVPVGLEPRSRSDLTR
jgi:ABC-2 type transport system ATP-binding protein